MKQKNIFLIITLATLFSCGFNSEESGNPISDGKPQITTNSENQLSELDKEGDFDGDLISNQKELELGRNPRVADIPQVEFKFMKDFVLRNGSSVLIDSQRDIVGQKYQYRVGDFLIKAITAKETSRFARYGGIVEGHFEPVDLTRIRYPKFSKNYLLEGNIKRLSGTEDTSVSFKNTITLKRNRGFQKISNPTFNFHYYNYESGTYELVDQIAFEKGIFEGVLEKFDVRLELSDNDQIFNNFSKRGEFLTAEIEDYEIDDLKTTYKSLMASVTEKTIPITVITPLGIQTYYVALGDGHNKLGHFLKSLYAENFKVKDGQLIQIGGFANSLPLVEELRNLKGETKKGKWFVLLNRATNFNLFDYEFQKGDQVVLNYMTGDELASFEKGYQLEGPRNFESVLNYQDIEIGDFSLNDSIRMKLKANHIRYEYYNVGTFGFNDSAGHSSWRFHDQVERKDELNFSRDENLSRLSLVVNGREFKLKDLINLNKVQANFRGRDLELIIDKVYEAFSLTEDDSYSLSLRAYPNNYQADIGLWLTGIGGWIAGQSRCGSADAVCKGWYQTNGIPLGRICSHIQPSFTNNCTGVLKDGYRKRSKTLRRDLNFDYSFLITHRFN